MTKKLIYSILIFLTTLNVIYSQKKEDKRTMEWKYEIECAGVAPEGFYMVKAFTYSDKKKLNMEQAKKNAVHGVLFKGFAGNTGIGCATVKPLCTNPNIEYEKREFFDTFFADGGKYMKYVNESNEAEASTDRAKIGKLYKIGIVIMVSKDLLRKDLESAGIIRSLKGF
jgi:hypothetical protein